MQRISEDLVRKRAEHNDKEIGSLEELSLHQEDLCKLEHLQNWCKDLKILLLHGNLIGKIENIGKLKKLEYINFSVNNIERIENLQGCESLKKLDFTLNFIGDLLSVENLKANIFLENLLLTGNPCTDYTGYRDYVIATLPQLRVLDGTDILPSERIQAVQNYQNIRNSIIKQQEKYLETREKQKKEKSAGLDKKLSSSYTEEQLENFWKSTSENTPEDRIEIAVMSRKAKEKGDKKESESKKREIRLFMEDGRPYNINQGKIPFQFEDDYYGNRYVLDLAIYKYLDTSLVEVDIQPRYVRVLVKKKVFQLRLEDEVYPDKSSANRSQTTGHLLLIMPKVKEVLTAPKKAEQGLKTVKEEKPAKREYLEIDETKLINISKMLHIVDTKKEDFVDDPEVPPLE